MTHGPLPTIADKLLFILTYVKQNPIQEVQGQLFGMSQSNANKWIHLLHAVLNHALAHQELLPARTADELAVMLARQTDEGCPHVPPFWHDGTERPIHRPADPEDQQDYYSGKKKCHTVKNLLVIDETCQICFLSATLKARYMIKASRIWRAIPCPPGSRLYQDMGFQGFMLDGDHDRPTQEKATWGGTHPTGESTSIAHLVHQHPYRTRDWWGETLSDRERQDTPLEGRDSRYHHGDVLWTASLSPTVSTVALCQLINIERVYYIGLQLTLLVINLPPA